MGRGAKVASWVAIPILALVLVLAFNLGAPVVLAQLADGVTVFDFQGIALPALADGVEVDLLTSGGGKAGAARPRRRAASRSPGARARARHCTGTPTGGDESTHLD